MEYSITIDDLIKREEIRDDMNSACLAKDIDSKYNFIYIL